MVAASPDHDAPGTTAALTDTGGQAPPMRGWSVVVVDGADAGKSIDRDQGSIVIGTQDGVDLQLTDPAVSRYHAELQLLPEGVLVKDLDSRNGVRLGGHRIDRVVLSPGTRMQVGRSTLEIRPRAVQTDSEPALDTYGAFVTADPTTQRMLEQLRRVAQTDATVLIEGETGSGKELLAQALHETSPRSCGRLQVVDCGAASPTLVESQLFGHNKGAFTGAVDHKPGGFEAANGGTVFLDEIGELPLDLQPKLLRALEAKTIRRLGDTRDRAIDVRFVAATHRDLTSMVSVGSFRQDLYFRIAVVRVQVPPLRNRPYDIPLIAERLLRRIRGPEATLAPAAIGALTSYDWPGNVRELRNIIERAATLTPRPRIEASDLFGLREPARRAFREAKEEVIARFEQRYVEALLRRHDGNISRAAREAGLSRNALYALMKRAGLETG